MQPVKIVIHGDYLDCQIYRGRLYLWTFDGKLKVYDWGELVTSLPKEPTHKIAMKFCFLDGNFLYKSDLVELFNDQEFKTILLSKFESVSKQHYELSSHDADKFLFGQQDTPDNSIPTDTEIYSNNLYYITEDGLFVSSAHRESKKYPVSSKPRKLWDCNLLSIKANKYPQLALSGGNEGLFELNLSSVKENRWGKNEPKPISQKHSSFANYTYLSIYNSSIIDKSFMALFNWHKTETKQKTTYTREYEDIINENKIFKVDKNEKFLSWGVEDKIYRATDNGFEIVKFNNRAKIDEGEKFFSPVRKMNLHSWKGKVIGGGTAYFGTIVECENALVVMLSNGANYTIEGPITRWRIYPRSLNYENHLHIIKEDRIEIYSFNQDYFLNQEDKILGIEYKQQKSWRGRGARANF